MEEIEISKNDELVMKLLHYFITEQGYNPIVLHGAKNEIWLENLQGSYKVVRIVTNYIHNDEQLNFDLFRTKQIMKRIKKKTLSFHMNTLSIFLNLGDNVKLQPFEHIPGVDSAKIDNILDLKKYDYIMSEFPDITEQNNFEEKGAELFMKITKDITEKNEIENSHAEDVFQKKTPIVTYFLIAVNIVIFFAMYLFGEGSYHVSTLLKFGALQSDLVASGDYYRLLTSAFVHIGALHLFVNMYSLYIIGGQLENFLGRMKFLIVYCASAIFGALLSSAFSSAVSAGASGAIFGLLGSLLYFGYHYRVYLGNVMRSQIIPIILLNLFIGFVTPGIDNAAHIGGLIGGTLITMAIGIKYKSSRSEKINGWILTAIVAIFLIYLVFFR